MSIGDLNLDEEIDKYQNCLDDDAKRWSVEEEHNIRSFGIQTMCQCTYSSLEKGRRKEMHLQGVHTYDILKNPIYTQAFQYVSADTPNREDYIVDYDADEGNDCA